MINTNSDDLEFGMPVRYSDSVVTSELTPGSRFRLGLFALLGYSVVNGISFGLVMLLVVFFIWVDFSTVSGLDHVVVLIVFISVLGLLISVMRVRFEKPKGYALQPIEYPEFFTRLDDISRCLTAPKIHQVILTSELDAAIVQTPRFGLFGCYHNTLVIGLELLLILSPRQADIVLIHVLGHYSNKHHGFNNWICQCRNNWQQLLKALDRSNGMAPSFLRSFLNWYLPKFNDYSAAIMHTSEYEVDALAAEMVHRDSVAMMLINRWVVGSYIEETYWMEFFQQADYLAHPPSPWGSLRHYLESNLSIRSSLQRRLQQSLLGQGDEFDTHPSLINRLAVLNARIELPDPSIISAAEIWFDTKYHRVIHDFDQSWSKLNEKRWVERYEYVTQAKTRLAYLKGLNHAKMTDEELWERAQLEGEFGDKNQAVLAFRSYQDRYPDHALTAFQLGCYASAAGSDEVLIQMRKALHQAELIIPACQYVCEYLNRNHREQESKWWQQQAEGQLIIDDQANAERTQLTISDQIKAYECDEATQSYLAERLRETGKIAKAWIAQKMVQFYPEYPVLIIVIHPSHFFVNETTLIDQLSQQLHLGRAFLVITKNGPYKSLAKQVITLNNHLI